MLLEGDLFIDKFNNTFREYPSGMTIQESFELQANNTPNDIALVFQEKEISYKELNENSNQLARVIRRKGIVPNDIVAIVMDRSIEMVIAILGILKAGGTFLPIDPYFPSSRIDFMLKDSISKIIITRKSFNIQLPANIEILDIEDKNITKEAKENLEIINKSSDIAYIIYTSGSTGKPKGVLIEHKSVVNFFVGITDIIDFKQGSIILALTTISFDIFILETILPLTRGLKIVIANESQQKNPSLLSQLIIKNNIKMLQITPSGMKLLLSNESGINCIKQLDCLMIGGEAFPKELFEQIRHEYFGCIYNMYGPTETTIWSAVKDLTHSEDITIGKPIGNTKIYIMSEDLNMQSIGIEGELCVSGVGVARGYYNRPELTNEKFIMNPFNQDERLYKTGDLARLLPNGELEYISRIDNQVKLRGYRIELGEIESYLKGYEGIKDCLVVAKERKDKEKYLVAYYKSGHDIENNELINYLSKNLPDYMIPQKYMRINEFPLTFNNKIDINALPEPVNERSYLVNTYIEPQDEIEKTISEIWINLLNYDMVGVNDNFFELGGNSLLVAAMYTELGQIFPEISDITDFFAYPTISKIAKLITEKKQSAESNLSVVLLELPGDYFIQPNEFSDSINLKFIINGKLNSILGKHSKDKNIEIIDILLSLYIYLLSQISNKDEISVQLITDNDSKAIQIDMNLAGIANLSDLFILTFNTRNNQLGEMKHNVLSGININPQSKYIMPVFCVANENTIPLNRYGIALILNQSSEEIEIIFEYDMTRLRKNKMQNLLFEYMKYIKVIALSE